MNPRLFAQRGLLAVSSKNALSAAGSREFFFCVRVCVDAGVEDGRMGWFVGKGTDAGVITQKAVPNESAFVVGYNYT